MLGTSPPHFTYEDTIQSLSDKQGRDNIDKSLIRLFCLLKIIKKRFYFNLSCSEIRHINKLIDETRDIYLDYVLEDI